MINDHLLDRFQPLNAHLWRPIYADYSFGAIPATIEAVLTGVERGPMLPADCFGGQYPQPRKVVLFFIDSFGWRFWQEALERHAVRSRPSFPRRPRPRSRPSTSASCPPSTPSTSGTSTSQPTAR
jgi:hypothetical protein